MAALAACMAFLCVLCTTSWSAAAPPPHDVAALSMTDAIEYAFDSGILPGLKALKDRGAQTWSILIAERLPSSHTFAVEIAVTIKGKTLRFPLKLKREKPKKGCVQAHWIVTWAPSAQFAQALVNILGSHMLSKADATVRWHQSQRMPTMPIIVTRAQIVTPYHVFKFDASEGGRSNISAHAPKELLPPTQLVRDTHTWLTRHLERDPGPASVDIIADGRVDWRTFQRVLFGVSSQGMFKIYFVVAMTRAKGALGVLEATAPVFGNIPRSKRPVPLIIAYYPQSVDHMHKFGWRVSYGAHVLPPDDTSCAQSLSFCTTDAKSMYRRFESLARSMRAKNKDAVTSVMFATSAGTLLWDALFWFAKVPQPLGLQSSKVFVGYIKH